MSILLASRSRPQVPVYFPAQSHLLSRIGERPPGGIMINQSDLVYSYFEVNILICRSDDADALSSHVYERMKRFKEFNQAAASVQLATYSDPTAGLDRTIAGFSPHGWTGWFADFGNDSVSTVELLHRDSERLITGITLDRHVVEGIRRWRVTPEWGGTYSGGRVPFNRVKVISEAYERAYGFDNSVGFFFAGKDAMYRIWLVYLEQIAKEAITFPGLTHAGGYPFYDPPTGKGPDRYSHMRRNPLRDLLPTRLGGRGTGTFDPVPVIPAGGASGSW